MHDPDVQIPFDLPTYVLGKRDARGNTSVLVRYESGVEKPLPMVVDDRGRPESDGFEWGYAGQGPHALAGSLIAFVLGLPATSAAVRASGVRDGDVVRLCVAQLPSEWVLSIAHLSTDVCVKRAA